MIDRANVTAIVLAGGRSSRFGRDKLAEPVDGRPLLEHAIDAVAGLASETIVVVAPDATPDVPDTVRIVRDPTAFEGPLVGVLTGLTAATGSRCVVVGGDMPALQQPVLSVLLAGLDDPSVGAAILEHGDDVPPLPLAIRPSVSLAPIQQAVEAGERRLRAIRALVPTRVVVESEWRRLDPSGSTLIDVDTPADVS